MRRTSPPVALVAVCLACFVCLFYACASLPIHLPEARETRCITELWEPVYRPDFAFEPYRAGPEHVSYTIGVIDVDFNCKTIPPGEWELTPQEQQFQRDFIVAFSEGMKKIVTGKGMVARGPYASYDEMTFIERARCDFVVQPKLVLELEPSWSTMIEELPEYGGPYGEPRIYGRSHDGVEARARLEFAVIDPRTRRELELHALKSDTLSKGYEQLWSQWTMTCGKNARTGWRVLEYNPKKYPNYHNADNATGKIMEEMYHAFMPRINNLVSVKEFDFLQERKKESKKGP